MIIFIAIFYGLNMQNSTAVYFPIGSHTLTPLNNYLGQNSIQPHPPPFPNRLSFDNEKAKTKLIFKTK